MTKTLTEQWREGTLPAGFYYLEMNDGLVIIDHTIYVVGEKIYRWELSSVDYVKEVLSSVPSYDEYKELVSNSDELKEDNKYLKSGIETRDNQIDALQKKLEIATKALKKYMTFCRHPAEEALKKMEGVK